MSRSELLDRRLRRGRSILVTPAHDAGRLAVALASPADFVVADLEDTVPLRYKARAREVVAELLTKPAATSLRMLRVNSGEAALAEDIAIARTLALDALVVPKATPELLGSTDWPLPVMALVESATGLRHAYEIACHPAVVALMLGAADLGAELGLIPRRDGGELSHARSTLVVDSAAAGLRPPFDGVFRDTSDEPGLLEAAHLVRSMGMGGKICLDPVQVALINQAFTPTAAELDWARQIADAAANADAAGEAQVHESIVDQPLLVRAQTLLAQASL
ncbi:MAG TPA: aldolase/citrate lyase family protein [Solirubrobacteraceae bacterium]|jgi:citrate lyase subunit beta/citryl-CoA lyase|nr:aldolase/citrate lyase family protein [Solirubrobacteraceae bacterium]